MIRTLVWKECREQRLVWLTFVILALVGVIGIQMTLTMPDFYVAAIQMCLPVYAYGLVCGAMLLTGERESGTLPFLDSLGATRSRIWMTKFLAGAALTFCYWVVVSLVLLIPSEKESNARFYVFALDLVLCWEALAWGLFFSAFTRRVFVGVLGGMAALAMIWFALAVYERTTLFRSVSDLGLPLAIRLVIDLAAATCSWFIFTKSDLTRLALMRSLRGWTRLAWLTFKQARIAAPALWATAMLVGFLAEPRWLLFWPVGTLMFGLLCGIAVYTGDQRGGAHRFLGVQRLPGSRIWLAKTALWFFVAACAVELFGLGRLVRWGPLPGIAETLQCDTTSYRFTIPDTQVIPSSMTAFALWAVYGFCIGQFFSLIMSKTLMAVIYALVLSLGVVALWIPAVVCGGLHPWQWCLPPLLLLVATRLSLWAWMTDRLHTVQAVRVLVGFSALAVLCLAGGISYRVVEVPDESDTMNIRAFEESLPRPAENEVGGLILNAMDEFQLARDRADEVLGQSIRPRFADNARLFPEFPIPNWIFEEQFDSNILENRRPDSKEIGKWLDLVCQGPWLIDLQKASVRPLGTLFTLNQRLSPYLRVSSTPVPLADVLAARAIRLQSQEKYKLALDDLVMVLKFSRILRNKAIFSSYKVGLKVEERALAGFDDLLRRRRPAKEDLWRALKALNRHRAELPSLADVVRAEFLYRGAQFRAAGLNELRGDTISTVGFSRLCAAVVPWEAARQERIFTLFFASCLRAIETPIPEGPSDETLRFGTTAAQKGSGARFPSPPAQFPPAPEGANALLFKLRDLLAAEPVPFLIDLPAWEWLPKLVTEQMRQLEMVRLQFAEKLYFAEHGKKPENPSDLLPRYLETIPQPDR